MSVDFKINSKYIYKSLSEKHKYPFAYDFHGENDFSNYTISLLASGHPKHSCIARKGLESEIFAPQIRVKMDKLYLSTMIAGLLVSDGKYLKGVLPQLNIIWGKVLNNKGQTSDDSIVSGLLWSLVKEVDLIVIYEDQIQESSELEAVLKKVEEANVGMIVCAQNDISFMNCLQILPEKKDVHIKYDDQQMKYKYNEFYTLYGGNEYILAPPTVEATAWATVKSLYQIKNSKLSFYDFCKKL